MKIDINGDGFFEAAYSLPLALDVMEQMYPFLLTLRVEYLVLIVMSLSPLGALVALVAKSSEDAATMKLNILPNFIILSFDFILVLNFCAQDISVNLIKVN